MAQHYPRFPESELAEQYVPIIRDRHQVIPDEYLNPGYLITPGFKHGEGRRRQTVYLAPGIVLEHTLSAGAQLPGLQYADSIGHIMLGGETARWEELRNRFNDRHSAEFYETVLRGTLGDESVVLQHLVTGIDGMTLFAYQDYGYTVGQTLAS